MRLQASHWLLVAAGGLLWPVTSAADNLSTEGVVRLGNAKSSLPSVEDGETGGTEQAGYRRRHSTGSAPACCPQDGHSHSNCRRCARGCRPRHGHCSVCGVGGRHAHAWAHAGYGCPHGHGLGCPHGVGHCGTCGIYSCHPCCAHLMHALHWLSPYHGGCTVPPDHGFAPPGHHSIPRAAVTYRRWFPRAWTGEPSTADPNFRYPMVYTPTDTTQLGFYYQRVPVWQRVPGMIPPPPRPHEWHVPASGVGQAGYCGPQGETSSGDSADAPSADGNGTTGSPDKPAANNGTSPVPEIRDGGSPGHVPANPDSAPAPPPPAA
jgi:hypothetical protein